MKELQPAEILVLKSGWLTTVQDLGRYGHQHYGVPISGTMDSFSMIVANRLVGNPDQTAILELTLKGPELQFEQNTGDKLVAIPSVIEVVGILAARPAFQALAGIVAVRARAAIEREDEVDQRALHFAALAKAISPASRRVAVEYFRRGLEQMDAIGSGDYQFANELMQFASSLHGEQLRDSDCNTLSNICELNLGEEHKIHWGCMGRRWPRRQA